MIGEKPPCHGARGKILVAFFQAFVAGSVGQGREHDGHNDARAAMASNVTCRRAGTNALWWRHR